MKVYAIPYMLKNSYMDIYGNICYSIYAMCYHIFANMEVYVIPYI